MLGGGTADGAPLPTAVEREYWSNALAAFDARDYEVAAMQFRRLGARSRPLYNVAICYVLLGDEDSAIVTFERAIRCDPYLCLAHYQLAYLFYQTRCHEKAIVHYNDAIQCMRGNGTIDYEQLGLEVTVYACELYYNMAIAQMALCDRGAALKSLVNAHQHQCLARHSVIDHAMIVTSDAATKMVPFDPPRDLVFRAKNSQRTLSLSSLCSTFQTQELNVSRSLVSVAEGEADRTVQFMAPVHTDNLQGEIVRVQKLRKHSRSSSLASSTLSAPSDVPLNLAKVHLVGRDDEIVQTRIFSLDDCPSMPTLLAKARKKFAKERIKLKYRDEVGDLITMTDEADLEAAYEAVASSPSTLKLFLWCFDSD